MDDENIRVMSRQVGASWTELARKLGFQQGEVDAINHDYQLAGLMEKIVQVDTRRYVLGGRMNVNVM